MRRPANEICALACVTLFVIGLSVLPALSNDPTTSRAGSDSADQKDVKLPDCFAKLKLSDDQQSKVRDIIGQYDKKIDTAWDEFHKKYMNTVRTEVELLAAVEDTLSEPQRVNIRNARHKAAHADASDSDPSAQEHVAPDNGLVVLTIEQEALADRVNLNYARHLRSLHRGLYRIHNQLISLEADKLVEIEKVLTKDQLAQLRSERQGSAWDRKSSSSSGSTKKE